MAYTADTCMTSPAVAVRADDPLEDVVRTMEKHQIRRVLVVDGDGCCSGIIAQADIAMTAPPRQTAELVSEVSRDARPFA
jgi:predicted transcriptional regulator